MRPRHDAANHDGIQGQISGQLIAYGAVMLILIIRAVVVVVAVIGPWTGDDDPLPRSSTPFNFMVQPMGRPALLSSSSYAVNTIQGKDVNAGTEIGPAVKGPLGRMAAMVRGDLSVPSSWIEMPTNRSGIFLMTVPVQIVEPSSLSLLTFSPFSLFDNDE
jgi:hypothetical protein